MQHVKTSASTNQSPSDAYGIVHDPHNLTKHRRQNGMRRRTHTHKGQKTKKHARHKKEKTCNEANHIEQSPKTRGPMCREKNKTTQSHAKESEQLTQQRRAHGERRGLYKEPEGEALDPPGRKQRNPNERGESTKGEVGQYGACTPMPEGRWQPRLTGEEEKEERRKERRGTRTSNHL